MRARQPGKAPAERRHWPLNRKRPVFLFRSPRLISRWPSGIDK
jgi:hypothetical protein